MDKWHTAADIRCAAEGAGLAWRDSDFDYLKRKGLVPPAATPPAGSGLGRWAYPPGSLEQTVYVLQLRQRRGEDDPGRLLALLIARDFAVDATVFRVAVLEDVEEVLSLITRLTGNLRAAHVLDGLAGLGRVSATLRRQQSWPRIRPASLSQRKTAHAAAVSLALTGSEPTASQHQALATVIGLGEDTPPKSSAPDLAIPLKRLADLTRLSQSLIDCTDEQLLTAARDVGWTLDRWSVLLEVLATSLKRRANGRAIRRWNPPNAAVGVLTGFVVNARHTEPEAGERLDQLITVLREGIDRIIAGRRKAQTLAHAMRQQS